jgi:hypothetical protein
MDTILKILEPFILFCVACFPITTAIMIFSLKRLSLDPVGSHVASRWSINIDMKFFSNLRKGYAIARGNKFIPFLNLISFYGGLFGVVVLPIIKAFYEAY